MSPGDISLTGIVMVLPLANSMVAAKLCKDATLLGIDRAKVRAGGGGGKPMRSYMLNTRQKSTRRWNTSPMCPTARSSRRISTFSYGHTWPTGLQCILYTLVVGPTSPPISLPPSLHAVPSPSLLCPRVHLIYHGDYIEHNVYGYGYRVCRNFDLLPT